MVRRRVQATGGSQTGMLVAIRIALGLILAAFAMAGSGARAQSGQALHVYIDGDSRRFTLSRQGQLGGPLAGKISHIMAAAGLPVSYEAAPWRRALTEVRRDPWACLIPTARLPAREDQFAWVGVIDRLDLDVFALAARDLKVRNIEDFAQQGLVIGVLTGQAAETVLESYPGLRRDPARTAALNVDKLIAGRIDAVALGPALMAEMAARPGMPAFQALFRLGSFDVAIACHRDLAPDVLARLRQAAQVIQP